MNELLENQEKQLAGMNEILGLLSTDSDVDIKYRLDVLHTLGTVDRAIAKCQENIQKLKENSTLIEKQIQLEELEKVLRGLDASVNSDTEKIGGIRTRIQDLITRKQAFLENEMTEKGKVFSLGEAAGDVLNSWNQEYEEALGKRPVEQFQNEYLGKRRNNSDRWEKSKTR